MRWGKISACGEGVRGWGNTNHRGEGTPPDTVAKMRKTPNPTPFAVPLTGILGRL